MRESYRSLRRTYDREMGTYDPEMVVDGTFSDDDVMEVENLEENPNEF